VSKRKGRRRKRPRPSRPVACPRCHSPADGSPGALLRALASVLNSCADSDMKIRFAHGVAIGKDGYVLPLAGGRWTARTLAYDPLSPDDGGED